MNWPNVSYCNDLSINFFVIRCTYTLATQVPTTLCGQFKSFLQPFSLPLVELAEVCSSRWHIFLSWGLMSSAVLRLNLRLLEATSSTFKKNKWQFLVSQNVNVSSHSLIIRIRGRSIRGRWGRWLSLQVGMRSQSSLRSASKIPRGLFL